jgi:hypothetical protein
MPLFFELVSSKSGSPAFSMKMALFQLEATANSAENEHRRVGWRSWIIDSTEEPAYQTI